MSGWADAFAKEMLEKGRRVLAVIGAARNVLADARRGHDFDDLVDEQRIEELRAALEDLDAYDREHPR